MEHYPSVRVNIWLATTALSILSVLGLSISLTPPATAASSCAVDAQPKKSIYPLRYIRTRVTIERGTAREARLFLIDEGGEITSSGVDVSFRVQQVEWKNVVLGPGEYEVVLRTSGGCAARDRLEVMGVEQPFKK